MLNPRADCYRHGPVTTNPTHHHEVAANPNSPLQQQPSRVLHQSYQCYYSFTTRGANKSAINRIHLWHQHRQLSDNDSAPDSSHKT